MSFISCEEWAKPAAGKESRMRSSKSLQESDYCIVEKISSWDGEMGSPHERLRNLYHVRTDRGGDR